MLGWLQALMFSQCVHPRRWTNAASVMLGCEQYHDSSCCQWASLAVSDSRSLTHRSPSQRTLSAHSVCRQARPRRAGLRMSQGSEGGSFGTSNWCAGSIAQAPYASAAAPRAWLSGTVFHALEESEKVPVAVGREYIGLPAIWWRDFEIAVEKVAAGCDDADVPCVPVDIDVSPFLMPSSDFDGVRAPPRIWADKVRYTHGSSAAPMQRHLFDGACSVLVRNPSFSYLARRSTSSAGSPRRSSRASCCHLASPCPSPCGAWACEPATRFLWRRGPSLLLYDLRARWRRPPPPPPSRPSRPPRPRGPFQ